MKKGFSAAFQLSPAIVGVALMIGSNAVAAPLIPSFVDDFEQPENSVGASLTDAGDLVQAASTPTPDFSQVTSVSQLSDVQPTDWAFQALQSLVERYGVIAGYPDGTFRGNRAMTRYEFAAGLNAALERINELIVAGLKERISEADLATLQRLRTDFAAELEIVRSRIDTLESTTKLNGFVSFNFDVTTALGDIQVERIDPQNSFSPAGRGADGKPIVTRITDTPNPTLSYGAALFLTTSFSGKDSLVTTLLMGNGNSPTNVYTSAGLFNTFGASVLDLAPLTPNDVILAETFYSFPVNKSLQVVVAPLFFWLRYFDTNAFTSAFGRGASGFNTFGSTLVQDLRRSTGAVLLWRINEQFEFRTGYAANSDAANPSRGLFDSTRALTAQLTYSPNSNINLRLLYDRSTIKPVDGQITTKPIIGVADDGFGGALDDASADAFGLNFDWLVTPKFGLFGRYTYATTRLNPVSNNVSDGNIRAQSVQLGLAFPDLGKRGALATLSYVMPFDVLDGSKFLVSGGGDGGTQFDIEATYYYPLTANIAIVPILHIIGNPNNFSDNPTVFAGILQAQFSF
jgi:Carbohydrate-selective porin, OprB family/S-layer homology domain